MNRDLVYLQHILESVEKIESYTAVGKPEFLAQSHWQDAVIRKLEVVGEATKKLSSELRARHDDVPWRRMAGLRDILIHDYMGVDLEAVWSIAVNEIPSLKQRMREIIATLETP